MKIHLLAAAAAALVAVLAPAQVRLVGTVDRVAAPGCDPAATHQIRCSDVLLRSSTVDLRAYEGALVDLAGSLALTPGCVTIDVDTVAPASASTRHIALFGTRLGRSVTFTTLAPVGSIVAHVFGCTRGFLPLGPLGTILIGLPDAVFVGTGISIGVDLRTERIPNDPTLVDVDIYYQFAYASLTTGFEAGFLNVGCFRIRE